MDVGISKYAQCFKVLCIKALYWLKLVSTGYSCLSLSVTVSELSQHIGHITGF